MSSNPAELSSYDGGQQRALRGRGKPTAYRVGGEENHVMRQDSAPNNGSELKFCQPGQHLGCERTYDPDACLGDCAGAEDQVPGQRLALSLRSIARAAEKRFLLAVAVTVADGGRMLLGDAGGGGHFVQRLVWREDEDFAGKQQQQHGGHEQLLVRMQL